MYRTSYGELPRSTAHALGSPQFVICKVRMINIVLTVSAKRRVEKPPRLQANLGMGIAPSVH